MSKIEIDTASLPPKLCLDLIKALNKPVPELEQRIITHDCSSYFYAEQVLKGRFELGEPIIATNGALSYYYALNVIKGRFELGEPAISKDATASFLYARDIL